MIKKAIDILSAQPPTWLIWVFICVAVLTLLIQISSFFYSVISRRRDRKLSVVDEYWFRTFLTPFCIVPLFEFLSDQLHVLEKTGALQSDSSGRDKMLNFSRDKRAAVSRLRALKPLSPEVYEDIARELADLYDYITLHCAELDGITEVQSGDLMQRVVLSDRMDTTFELISSKLKLMQESF